MARANIFGNTASPLRGLEKVRSGQGFWRVMRGEENCEPSFVEFRATPTRDGRGTKLSGIRRRYDFENMKSWKNPYAKHLKQSVTIRLDQETVVYFKGLAGETGMPYQNLINLYLRDCAAQKKKLKVEWAS